MAGVGSLFRQWYLEMPPVTRAYSTACFMTTLAVQLDIVSPFQLYYNPMLIWKQYQVQSINIIWLQSYHAIFETRYHVHEVRHMQDERRSHHASIFMPHLLCGWTYAFRFKADICIVLIRRLSAFFKQLWRLATTFLFFGTFGFNFLFNMLFTHRYCRMLEENSFRGRTSDFVMMFLFGAFLMIVFAFFVNLLFLGK